MQALATLTVPLSVLTAFSVGASPTTRAATQISFPGRCSKLATSVVGCMRGHASSKSSEMLSTFVSDTALMKRGSREVVNLAVVSVCALINALLTRTAAPVCATARTRCITSVSQHSNKITSVGLVPPQMCNSNTLRSPSFAALFLPFPLPTLPTSPLPVGAGLPTATTRSRCLTIRPMTATFRSIPGVVTSLGRISDMVSQRVFLQRPASSHTGRERQSNQRE